MKKYGYGRITVLATQLERAAIPQPTVAQILEGAEAIGPSTPAAAKAAWMRQAMQRMDKLLDRETRYSVREACACCLGGKRLELSKAIARDHASLEERIAAANETRFVFGHSVTREADGSVLVRFAPEGLAAYQCVCLRQAGEPISITYCYCCGGHVKHHLQHALGCKLVLQVRSSALSSGGKRPCAFRFTFADEGAAAG